MLSILPSKQTYTCCHLPSRVFIILAILVPVLLLGRLRNIYLILMIITTVWLGFLGGMDDFIKIFKRDKEGLKGKYKIIGQIGIGLIVGLVLWSSPDVKMNENLAIEQQGQETVVKHRTEARKSLKTTIPFVKGHNLDYSITLSCFLASVSPFFTFKTFISYCSLSAPPDS